MGDPQLDEARAQKVLDWEEYLHRVPLRAGLRVARSIDSQINLSKAYGFGTFLKNVVKLPNTPHTPENGPLVMSGNLYRANGVFTPIGVTDDNPMPTLFWGSQCSVQITEVAAPTTDQAVVVANQNVRFAKTATVKADPANAQTIYVRGDGQAITAGPPITGFPLSPADVQVFPVKDLTDIHVYAAVAGVRIAILYIPDKDLA
jgi:hypothetical protein